ncbi:hypothetical protein MNBD_GAMMA13-1906 [hydrothermal vent metagenome]|uniref:Uncharacterized protein n=1 Tax=hydrothermal vent metagenome TaxID=652676 RepID=A0A3B0ZB79_9ZZZZ
MHQSAQSDSCPDCTGHSCEGSACSPDHCASTHSQFSAISVMTALLAGSREIRDAAFSADIATRSDPPLLRPPV